MKRFLALLLTLSMLLTMVPLPAFAQDEEEPEIIAEETEQPEETEETEQEETAAEETEPEETVPEETVPEETEPEETAPEETEPEETEPEETGEEPEAAEQSAAEAMSGTCGKNLTWFIEDGTLTIRGSGDMYDFEQEGAPWYPYNSEYRDLVIEEGVTSLGWYAFQHDFEEGSNITIPASLKESRMCAFDGLSIMPNANVWISDLAAWCNVKFSVYATPLVNGTLFINGETCSQIAVPQGVSDMTGTFMHCGYQSQRGISSVIVPASVGNMADVFYSCSSIKSVVFLGDAPKMNSRNFYAIGNEYFYEPFVIYYPEGNETWEQLIQTAEFEQCYLKWIPYDSRNTDGFLYSPENTDIENETTTVLYAQTAGHGTVYQWQFRKDESDEWHDLPGQDRPSLYIIIEDGAFGSYRCRAEEKDGRVCYSDTAEVRKNSQTASSYSRLLVDDTFRYLEEFYSQNLQLALRVTYGTEEQIEQQRILANALAEGCKTQREILQADYEWVKRNITYMADSPSIPADILNYRIGDCMAFLQMINVLCRLQGIPAVMVTGYRADLSEFSYAELKQDIGHGWSYVYIDGEWALVDVGFGDFLVTDRDYIAQWCLHELVEGVIPVYSRPQLDHSAVLFYINGAFTKEWKTEKKTIKAADGMSVNGLDFTPAINKNGVDGYYGYPIIYGWNVHENNIYFRHTILEKDGVRYDANNGYTLLADPEDLMLHEGFIAVKPGFVGPIYDFTRSPYTQEIQYGSNYRIEYSSSDPSVAQVDEYGTVTAVAPGTVLIDVKAIRKSDNGISYDGGFGLSVEEEYTLNLRDDFPGHTHTYKQVPSTLKGTVYSCTYPGCADSYVEEPEQTEKVYKIRYILNGGTNDPANPKNRTASQTVALLPAGRACYSFLGWYTDAEFMNPISEIPAGTEGNLILYARWSGEPEHKLVTVPGKPPTCTDEGVTDLIYCTECEEVLSEQIILPNLGHDLVTVPGKPPTCTDEGATDLIYCTECGEVLSEQIILSSLGHDFVLIPAQDPTDEEEGWVEHLHCNNCGMNVTPEGFGVLETVVIPAKMIRIHYILDGGVNNAKNPDTYERGSGRTVTLYAPTKASNGFGGWYLDGRKVTKLTPSMMKDAASITLTAKWNPFTANLAFKLNGVKAPAVPAMKGVFSAVTLTEPEAVEGYRFLGWNTKADGSGTDYPAGETELLIPKNKASIALHAQWEYEVSFDPMGGEGEMEQQTMYIGRDSLLSAGQYTKDGYTFAGWAISESAARKGTVKYKDGAKVRNLGAGAVLYAVWKGKSVTVSFDANGGSGKLMKAQKLTWGKPAALKANTYKNEGMLFTGWSADPNAAYPDYRDKEKAVEIPTAEGVYAETVTLYAVWKDTYTVHFDANGGTKTMKDQLMPVGVDWPLNAAAFKKTGYTLAGWALTPDGDVVYDNKASVTDLAQPGETVTLYAVWKQPCTVTFSANGGKGTMPKFTFWWGEKAELPAAGFTRTGKTFRGWCTNKYGNGTIYEDGAVVTGLTETYKKTVTLYAIWN